MGAIISRTCASDLITAARRALTWPSRSGIESFSHVQRMSLSKIIEFSSALLVAFLILSLISFLSLRPILQQGRIETGAEWDAFHRAVKQRNELLPSLVEGLRGYESGHGRLAGRIMEARSISMRAVDPDQIVAAVDEIDRTIEQVKKIVQVSPDLRKHPPFEKPWKQVLNTTRRISAARKDYNQSAQLYNRLLTPFPQNMITTLFGFVPIKRYPPPFTIEDEDF